MDKGLNIYEPAIGAAINFNSDTENVTSGLNQGVGPRYGFSPIPGHMDQEPPPSPFGGGARQYGLAGLMASETGLINNPGPSFHAFWNNGNLSNPPTQWARKSIYAIYPQRLRGPGEDGEMGDIDTYYSHLVGFTIANDSAATPASEIYFDIALGSSGGFSVSSINTGNPLSQQLAEIYAPLGFPGIEGAAYPNWDMNQDMSIQVQYVPQTTQSATGSQYSNYLRLTDLGATGANPWHVSTTSFAVNGPQNPMTWLIGGATSHGDATHAPNMNLTYSSNLEASWGFPPSFNYGNFPVTKTFAASYALGASADFNINYSLAYTPTSSIYEPSYYAYEGNTMVDVSTITATKDTAGTGYTNTSFALLNDPNLLCDSSYQGYLAAIGKAVCFIIQDWYRARNGMITQTIDLTNMPSEPSAYSYYLEEGTKTPISFAQFPNFVRDTPISTSTSGIGLGAANTGILRSNTVYELAYAHFDKRLNFESNVGLPVKFQTGDDDLISLILFTPPSPPQTQAYVGPLSATGAGLMPWIHPDSTATYPSLTSPLAVNYLEYRFYYREENAQEWLPALFIDASQWWFYPQFVNLSACTGGIGGSPGGRPDGFNDYSRLPQDKWTCVLFYKNRAFWVSEKQIVFSLANNVFAYPQGNQASCPIGSFKGAITQAYYGQAQQDARIVVFGTAATYVGKFTGNLIQVPVQVSIDTVGNYGLDGSDFNLDIWTTVTAFSYRSAVVAEGILYFWGPQGVFMDDGVNPLTKISGILEPDLFNYYDASQTDEVHCCYSDSTKEITWFFPPKGGDATYPTHALIWSRISEEWLPAKYGGYVDATQQIKIDTNLPTAGTRTLAFSRESPTGVVQRAYFYDHMNRGGDIFPSQEMMVSSFTTPAAGERTLTLAQGYTTDFNTIAAGDLISVIRAQDYDTSLTLSDSFIGKVISSATGINPTITIQLPDDVDFDASGTIAASAHQFYFPIWHSTQTTNGINGFPYVIQTNYWLPQGMSESWNWIYLYLLFKYTGVPSVTNPVTGRQIASAVNLAYRSLVCAGTISDTLNLINNSDGHCQVHHPLRNVGRAGSGQAIKFALSGIHIGNPWILEYVEAHCKKEFGFTLKEFEG